MAWKRVCNSEPDFRIDSFSGKCPRFNKNATVTINSTGTIVCKTDLQKTYHKSGFKCSLLEGTNEASFSPCMENCPIVSEKYI